MPSLLEALELKYGSSTTDCSLTDEEAESGSPKASSSALSISIFIPKKSPRHTVPALLVLQDCDISCAGNDDDKLRTKCRNVEELDLAQNKLSRWDEVFGILRHMPKIKFVNLSFNSLADTLMLKDEDCYKSLRNLVLNGTRVTWSTVQELARILENLEELHLSLNEYRTVELDHTKPEVRNASLKKLHLTGNPIETWQEISKLGYVFPHLESLVLAECPIRSLACPEENLNHEDHHHQQQRHHHHRHQHHHHHHHHHQHHHQYQQHHRDARKRSNSLPRQQDENENPNGENSSSRLTKPENCVHVNDEEQHGAVEERDDKSYNRTESECESSANKIPSSHDPFRMLRFLNVNGTLLSTWDDVERLARFPALKSLRMQGCPLFESPREYTEHERRQLLIARLPNVETLNGGGLISSQEREDAERAFIRYYMDKPEADRPESHGTQFQTQDTKDKIRRQERQSSQPSTSGLHLRSRSLQSSVRPTYCESDDDNEYSELVGIHGKLDPLVHVDLTPEKRVKVTFTYGDLVEVRSVDVYRTVFELKTKLESMVKIPANRMRLFYVDQVMKAQYGPEEMLYPNKQLYRYNIRNGDEIIIDSKLNRLVSTSSSSSSIRS